MSTNQPKDPNKEFLLQLTKEEHIFQRFSDNKESLQAEKRACLPRVSKCKYLQVYCYRPQSCSRLHSCYSPRSSHATPQTPPIAHRSSNTAHHTPLITHYSSCTTLSAIFHI
jgi:hypothetical protein